MNNMYEWCIPHRGLSISARVGSESVTCVVQDTHYDVDFRAVGDTQTMTRLLWE